MEINNNKNSKISQLNQELAACDLLKCLKSTRLKNMLGVFDETARSDAQIIGDMCDKSGIKLPIDLDIFSQKAQVRSNFLEIFLTRLANEKKLSNFQSAFLFLAEFDVTCYIRENILQDQLTILNDIKSDEFELQKITPK